MNSDKRILIIGGGLAGSFLAVELCREGYEVDMVDDMRPNSPSRIAAGLFNVVTGRLASKTWKAEEFLTGLASFFAEEDMAPLARHLHYQEIFRPFRTTFEYNEWSVKATQPDYKELVAVRDQSLLPDQINNPDGGLRILPCGWVDVGPMIAEMKERLAALYPFTLHKQSFDYASLDPATQTWSGQGKAEVYDEVVFAEGVGLLDNPFFPGADLRPLKGQILELEIPDFDPGCVISRKVYIIPRGNFRFVCGSTYERHFTDWEPDAKGREMIENQLKEAIKVPWRVLDARASLRPTSPNRRPILGSHPTWPHLHLVNGLGTKGLLQAHWCARQMCEQFAGKQSSFIKDVRIERILPINS